MKNSMVNFLKELFIQYFPFVVVFSYSLFVPSDSDMGWHLKYGEYFFQTGTILRDNIFSTMMPDFKWVNSSWLTDLITYFTYSRFGFWGLSILAALVIAGIFYLFSKVARLSFWEKALIFPLILYLEKPFIEVSFRGQLLSIFLVSVLYYIFHLYTQGKKKVLYLLIPLFTLWSNLHGQFILGLGLLVLLIFFHTAYRYFEGENKKERQEISREGIFLVLIFLSAIAATLINPFGISIYTESIKHFANPLQKFIVEWLPFERFSLLWWKLMLWEAIIIAGIGITIYRKKFFQNCYHIIPVIILLILSVQVRRYMWVLLLVSIPVAKVFFEAVKPKIAEISGTIAVIVLLTFYGYILLVKAPSENIITMNWDRYCDITKCSPKSAQFLSEAKLPGRLMTFYNWGGWLIANYPKIKVSIDGRMHLWKDETGYSAFLDYYPYEQNRKDIDASDYDVVFMSPVKPVYRRLLELVKTGKWKIVYSDPRAAIFVRTKLRS